MNTEKCLDIPYLVFIGNNEVRDDLGPAKMYSEEMVLVPKIVGYVEGKMDGTVTPGSYVTKWMPLIDWPPGETPKEPESITFSVTPMWVWITLPFLLGAIITLSVKLYNATH